MTNRTPIDPYHPSRPRSLGQKLCGGALALGLLLGCGGAGGQGDTPAVQVGMGGAALTLDVVSATDDRGGRCRLHSPHSAHVTIICLKADKARIKPETERFVADVQPYLPEMIRDSMSHHMGGPGPVAFAEGTYTTNLFHVGIKAYEPGPACRVALVALNQKLTDFVHGNYVPTAPGPHPGLGSYALQVEATTRPGRGAYTPHVTVRAPSTYAGSDQPVLTVSATLQQALTTRYYSY